MTSFSPIFPQALIGIGTFPFSSPFHKVEYDVSVDVMRTYLTTGGKYIDVAPTYAFGETEKLLGSVASEFPRESLFINTSCGWVRKGDGYVLSGARDDIQRDLEQSLERLRLDYVDSYISHMPDPNTPFAETVGGLLDVKERGFVRHIGVSNVSFEQLQSYCQQGRIEVVQNRFSLINRSFSTEFLALCQENHIAIVAYQVIERGLLTDRDDSSTIPGPNDLRSRKPEFAEGPRTTIRRWVNERLRPIAQGLGVSTEALAVRWAASQPGVAVVQFGVSSGRQLETLTDARGLVLDDATLGTIEEAYAELSKRARAEGYSSVRDMMGLENVDPLKNISVSGR